MVVLGDRDGHGRGRPTALQVKLPWRCLEDEWLTFIKATLVHVNRRSYGLIKLCACVQAISFCNAFSFKALLTNNQKTTILVSLTT